MDFCNAGKLLVKESTERGCLCCAQKLLDQLQISRRRVVFYRLQQPKHYQFQGSCIERPSGSSSLQMQIRAENGKI